MADIKILLECAKSGNAEAFGDLYELYAKELYLYALKYLGNKEDAEDAVSQATLNVYKSIANVRNINSFKAYYFKVLANTARTMLKKSSVHMVDIDENTDIQSYDNTENDALDRCSVDTSLKKLNADEREIILLSAVCGLNSVEISKITDFTSGAVRSKLSRTISKMRTELARE